MIIRRLTMLAIFIVTGAFAQPIITRQPTNQSVSLGASAMFQVTATSAAPLSYQWRYGEAVLAGATNRILSLTNVQLSDAGDYAVAVSDSSGSTISEKTHLEVDTTFTKIMNGRIVTDTGYSLTCAWADYNNDGWTDLLVAYGDSLNVLYRNMGDGTFARATNVIGNLVSFSIGAGWADINNDGWLDLFIANSSDQPLFLFTGGANEKFTRITRGNIVTDQWVAHGGMWGDYDGDGLVDLFVANFKTGDQGATVVPPRNVLYRNLGNQQFERILFEPKTANSGSSSGATWCDFDGDGDLDLFVPNGGHNGAQLSDFYRNEGNGKLTRLTNAVPALDPGHFASSAWGDYDNDGHPDLFVANLSELGGGSNLLYRNNGDGTFVRVTSTVVTKDIADSYGCAWADYNNDGYLDLFVSNGEYALQKNFLYHNNGDGSFTRIVSGSLANDLGASTGCAWADYNNDGFLDLFVSNYYEGVGPPQRNFLYKNNGNTNGWITCTLVGTESNRAAIGAKVRVRSRIGGRTVWQLREISGGSGFSSQNDLRASFGLGNGTNVDFIRVEWPSGTVQELANIRPRQFITIKEPPRLAVVSGNSTARLAVRGLRNLQYDIEASTNLSSWFPIHVETVSTNNFGAVEFVDANASRAEHTFYRAVLR